MRRLTMLFIPCLLAPAAFAQKDLDRSFPITGRPSLRVEADNATVRVTSCGDCRNVSVHIDLNDQQLSEYRLDEGASGNSVHVHLKRRENHSVFDWHSSRQPHITVELPTQADLDVDSGNGELQISGLEGDLHLHTGNGAARVERSSGSLRLDSGNGAITVHDGGGRAMISTGNGEIHAEGRFTQMEAHTGNGKLHVALAHGTALTGGVHLTSGNGEVDLAVPRDLRASVNMTTGSGGLHSDLPLSGSTGDDSDRHRLHGDLNGGGPAVTLNSGSGSIRVNAL